MAATSLIVSGLIAAGSAGLSAYNRAKADKERQASYENARSYLNSLYYRDPLSTVGNQSLLKAVRQNHADELDAIQNRSVAGGATMENQLAARQASNEGLDRVYGQLLMGEDARRERIDQQRLALDQQNSAAIQSSYRQAAQDWQAWGAQTAGAMMSYGSTNLLDNVDMNAVSKAAAQQHENWSIPATGEGSQNLGGLRGVYKNYDGQLIKK